MLLLAVLLQEWEIDATLRADGALEVRQRMRGTEGRLGLDRAGLDRIESIALEGASLVVREEMRVTWLEWSPAPEVTLTYVVWGAVREAEPGLAFEWRAISEYRAGPVRTIEIRLRLPRAVPDAIYHADSACRRSDLSTEGYAFVFRGEELRGRGYVTLFLRLPAGVVEAPTLLNQELKVRYGTLLLFGPPGACFLVLLTLYLLRGRDPRVANVVAGPDTLPPGLSGVMIDEVAGAPEATATIVDLLRRGALATDGNILSVKSLEGLAPFEQAAARSVSGTKEAPSGGAVCDAIYAEAVARGFFRRSPAVERRACRIAGAALVVAGILFAAATARYQLYYLAATLVLGVPLSLMAASFQFERSRTTFALLVAGAVGLGVALPVLIPWLGRVGFTWHAKLAIGLTLCGPILVAFAPVLPAKTLAGAEAKERAAAGMRELEAARPEEFESLLAHAIAFRMKKPFVYRMAAAGAKTPSWWSPPGEPLEDHLEPLLAFLGALSARYGREASLFGGG
jgi:hypothetical protein